MSHRRRVVNRRPACRLFATRTLIMCHMGCEQPLGRTARLRRWLAGRAAVCNPPPVSNSRRAILNEKNPHGIAQLVLQFTNRPVSRLASHPLVSRLKSHVKKHPTARSAVDDALLTEMPRKWARNKLQLQYAEKSRMSGFAAEAATESRRREAATFSKRTMCLCPTHVPE